MKRLEGKSRVNKIKNITKNKRLLTFFNISEYLFDSDHLTKMINNIMKHSKKDIAERQLFFVLKTMKHRLKKNPEYYLYLLHKKMLPRLKIQLIKKAKRTYHVPTLIVKESVRAIIEQKVFLKAIKLHKGMSFKYKMLKELYAINYDDVNSHYLRLHNSLIFDGILNRIYSHYRY